MKAHADAFGQELLDYHDHGGGFDVVERDDGLIDLSLGLTYYFAEYRDWPAVERRAMRYVRGCVLDVGCGAGRCCLYLERKGHEVLGVDVSPLVAKVCRLRGVKKVTVAPITRIDSSLGTFDTVLMMGNNFGLFGTPRRAAWLLRRWLKMTSPAGRIVTQSLDPYRTDDPAHLAYHRRNRKRGRLAGQVRIRLRYRQYASPWFDCLFVSPKEMQRIVRGTGWAISRFVDDGGPQYVAVLEKERG